MVNKEQKEFTGNQTIDTDELKIKNNSTTLPDDEQDISDKEKTFFTQVANSVTQKRFDSQEIIEKQREWQKYDDEKVIIRKKNDFPDYFFAGFWIRLFAFIFDLICIGVIIGSTVGLFFALFHLKEKSGLYTAFGLLSAMIYLLYFILMTKFNKGQTLGKMLFGIRVISFDEEELSWQTVLIREGAARFILQYNFLCYAGYLPTIFTIKKQHLGDYFANTSVVTLNLIKAFNKEAHS